MSNTLPFPRISLNCTHMAMVVNALPFSTHIRSLESDQYMLANLNYVKQLGFQRIEEVVHLSHSQIIKHWHQRIFDLGGNLELANAYHHFMHQTNLKTEHSKKPRRFQICTLFPNGWIYVCMVQNIPLSDNLGKTTALLTFAQDITTHFDLIDLYQLYRKHYLSGKNAIQYFIEYLDIQDYFRCLPTHRELLTLLVFRKDIRAKYAAKQLNLSDRTIEEYKARLRNKLQSYITLEQLLLSLRNPFKSYQDIQDIVT